MRLIRYIFLLLLLPLAVDAQDFAHDHPKPLKRVICLLEEGKPGEVIEMLQPYLSKYTKDYYVLSAMASANRQLGKNQEALYYYGRIIAHDPNGIAGFYGQADILYDMGLRDSALKVLAIARRNLDRLKIENSQQEAVFRFKIELLTAGILMVNGDYADAATSFDALVSMDPASATAHANYGWCLGISAPSRLDEALESLETASKLAPQWNMPLWYKYQLLQGNHRRSEAFAVLESAYSKFPQDTTFLEEMALLMVQRNRISEGVALVEKSIRLGAHSRSTLQNYAVFLSKAGRLREALDVYDQLLMDYPQDAKLNGWRSQVLVEMGDPKTALANYERSMAGQVGSLDYLYYRGCLYSKMDRWEEAIVDFNKVVEMDSTQTDAINNRGYGNYFLKRYAVAMEDIELLVSRFPGNVDYLGFRGTLHHEMGKHDLALADFAQVLEIEPERHITIFERSKTYEFLEQYDKALADCEAALRLDPGNAEYKAAIVRIKSKQAGK